MLPVEQRGEPEQEGSEYRAHEDGEEARVQHGDVDGAHRGGPVLRGESCEGGHDEVREREEDAADDRCPDRREQGEQAEGFGDHENGWKQCARSTSPSDVART